MEEMDRVEVTVEKKEYARNGVHKGMQGCIMDARVNERIKAQFDALEQEESSRKKQADTNISDYLV